MGDVVNLVEYKYNQMDLMALMLEAEQCARMMEKGNLSKAEKNRCLVVFNETYKKADNEELRYLMTALLRVINLL